MNTSVSVVTYQVKKELIIIIMKYMRVHNLKQAELAERLNIKQSRISEMATFKTHRFTVDVLMRYCERLDLKWLIVNS